MSIGTGLFVGSGSALATGGPASLIIAYGLIGAMLFCTVHALGEMAVTFPVAGSFAAYSTRFLDPAWGFASELHKPHSRKCLLTKVYSGLEVSYTRISEDRGNLLISSIATPYNGLLLYPLKL